MQIWKSAGAMKPAALLSTLCLFLVVCQPYWNCPWSEMSDEHFWSIRECYCKIFLFACFGVTDNEHYDLLSSRLCRRPY